MKRFSFGCRIALLGCLLVFYQPGAFGDEKQSAPKTAPPKLEEPPLPQDFVPEEDLPELPDEPPLPQSGLEPEPLPNEPLEDEPDPDATPVPSVKLRPNQIPRTFSNDSPFQSFGPVAQWRSEAFRIAESTRKELLAALQLPKDAPRLPILLQTHHRVVEPSRAVRGFVRADDATLSIQIDIAAGEGVPDDLLREAVVRWCLVEMMLRQSTAQTLEANPKADLPDWVYHGCLELMDYRKLGRPSAAFAKVFELGKTLTIQEILNADASQLDSVSSRIFRISSCAFLLLLLDKADGPARLRTFLAELPASTRNVQWMVEKHFPYLRGAGNSLEKWWALQLAAAAQPALDELMSMQESEAALEQALTLEFPRQEPAKAPAPASITDGLRKFFSGKETPAAAATPAPPKEAASGEKVRASLPEYAQILNRKDRVAILRRNSIALTNLSFRIHPFYRGLVTEYQILLEILANGSDKGVNEKLAELAKKRQRMLKDAQDTEDYLDWFQATQNDRSTGVFRPYLRAAESLEHSNKRRNDPVAGYLDLIERELKP